MTDEDAQWMKYNRRWKEGTNNEISLSKSVVALFRASRQVVIQHQSNKHNQTLRKKHSIYAVTRGRSIKNYLNYS